MGKKKNFLLLSLEDDKAKKVANIINNASCKKILDFLTENEATETEIANKLKMPISSVHYNLQQLLEAKLIDWEKYHYSEKGKEVRHYTVANKYIVIVPKGEESGIREKLKSIIPTSLMVLLGTFLVHIFTKTSSLDNSIMMENSMGGAIESMPMRAAKQIEPVAYDMVQDSADIAISEPSIWQTVLQSSAFWFFAGALFALIVILIVKKIRNRKNK